ncbi:hypothetical protein NPIL_676401 [Nephila pilipes]|uniref:Uncharacterized protein n=1 Tax=Nephila pilipes TaxID=299642 RepID=A0A8X6MRU7_NEPPI|nr:hypothetical protein NPIL_676401 [Nephila pilipes]
MDSASILFDLNKFWKIEELQSEKQDFSEKETFENYLRLNGERYVCKLMWMENMGPSVELNSNYESFVANRTLALTLPECWGHCNGSDYPADLTTRGECAGKILSCSLWWSGPVWLSRLAHSCPCRDLQYSLQDILTQTWW